MSEVTEFKAVLAPPDDTDPPTAPIATWDNLIGINPPYALVKDMATPYDYGAIGDGVTDDTLAIQAWLDAIAGTAGFLQTGTYLISSILYISGNTTIYGAGAGAATISASSDFPAATQLLINRNFNASGQKGTNRIAIYGVCFQGSSTQEVSVEMIAMGGVESLIYRDCKFQHWRRHLTTYANCNNVLVEGCEFFDWGSLTPATDPDTYDGGYALWLGVLDTNVRVVNNYIHDGQWTGIHLGSPTIYLSIDNNFFENLIEAAMFGGCTFASITNNKIQNVGFKAISGHGIELGAESSNVVIAGNTFNSTALASIYLTNNFVVTVAGNTCNTPNQYFAPGAGGTPGAINLLNSTLWTQKMDRVNVCNNVITDGTGRSSYGIRVADDVGGITNTLIANNNLGPASQWLSMPILCADNACGAGFMIRDNNCAPGADRSCISVNFIIPSGSTGSFTIPGVGFEPCRVTFQATIGSATETGASSGQDGPLVIYDLTSQTITQARQFGPSGISWAADGTNGYSSDNGGRASIAVYNPDGEPICAARVTAVNTDGFTLTIVDALVVSVNSGGSNYAVGDTGTIAGGDGLAQYTVLTESGGAALTVSVVDGSGYLTGTGVATTAGGDQPGTPGTGLTLDLISGSPTTEDVVVTGICQA